MLVLRKNMQETIGRQVRDDLFERHARSLATAKPYTKAGDRVAFLDDGIGEIELLVQFQGPGVHGQRPRRRSGLRRLVDYADGHTLFRKPERKDKSRRSCADDQHAGVCHCRFSSRFSGRRGDEKA